MAIFGKYTGQRVQPLPAGFLSSATASAALTHKGLSEAGKSIGDAIAGYMRQKRSDQAITQKLAALRDQFTGADTTSSVIPEGVMLKAAEDDAMATAVRNRTRAEDQALAIGHIDKRITDLRSQSQGLMQGAEDLNRRAEKLADASRKPTPANQRRIDYLNTKVKRLEALERKDRKAGKFSPARVKEIKALREQSAALVEQGSPLDPAFDELIQGVTQYGQEAYGLDEQAARAEKLKADTLARYAKPLAPITAAADEIKADPSRFAQEVTEPGQLEEELAQRVGPKLLKKMTSGEMTRGDELLLIDIIENYRTEKSEARTPQGQLTQLQLEQLQGAAGRQQQAVDLYNTISSQPAVRQGRVAETVTPESLMAAVQRGDMTAAEAIQREEAIVDLAPYAPQSPQPQGASHRLLMDWVNQADAAIGGIPSFPSRTRPKGEKIPSKPGHDYYNPDAYKTNKSFQREYGPEGLNYNDEKQRRMWEIEKEGATTNAPEDLPPPTVTPPAPPMEMEQQFEREVPIPVAEQKQRAMDLLNRSGIRPGTAEHTAAVTEIARRFGPAVEIKRIEGANLVLVDGQYKAAIPVTKGKGIVGIDSVRIPGTNRIQPMQTSVDGTMTPMGASVEATDGQIDREFKVDSLGPNAYTLNKTRADQLRQQVSDIQFANDAVNELIAISKMTGEEAKLERRGIAKSLTATMIGRLRVTLMGPGVLSNEDVKRIMAAIPDPTKILAFDKQEIAALRQTLKSLKSGLVNDFSAHIEGGLDNVVLPSWLNGGAPGAPAQGGTFFDYDAVPGGGTPTQIPQLPR